MGSSQLALACDAHSLFKYNETFFPRNRNGTANLGALSALLFGSVVWRNELRGDTRIAI